MSIKELKNLKQPPLKLRHQIIVLTLTSKGAIKQRIPSIIFSGIALQRRKIQGWELPFKYADRRCNGALPNFSNIKIMKSRHYFDAILYFLRVFFTVSIT